MIAREGWKHHRGEAEDAHLPEFDDANWETVALPHNSREDRTNLEHPPFSGECWYRTRFEIPADVRDKRITLHFGPAMNRADVWLDGRHLATHRGDFLPFVVDISQQAEEGEHLLAVHLISDDPAQAASVRLSSTVDFCVFGGLQRPVELRIRDRLYIADEFEGDARSGGIAVDSERLSGGEARVRVSVHVRNDFDYAREAYVRMTLQDPDGRMIGSVETPPASVEEMGMQPFEQVFIVPAPALWSPISPSLYKLEATVVDRDGLQHSRTQAFGIRTLQISESGGVVLNGERVYLRGVYRHEEYPFVGNAMSAEMHERDALRIRSAGFNFVRMAHHPQSAAFLDACDRVGLLVMNCVPGWLWYSDSDGQVESAEYRCRSLVKRDRNHPSVVLWEISLNESNVPDSYVRRLHEAVHAVGPNGSTYTLAWEQGDIYDVHGRARIEGPQERWSASADRVLCEYGMPDETDANGIRALTDCRRGSGHDQLLYQAQQYYAGHVMNRESASLGDSLHSMFDHNSTTPPGLATIGCLDMMRLNKYAAELFRSLVPVETGGPVVAVASPWAPYMEGRVVVFTNCDVLSVFVNGQLKDTVKPEPAMGANAPVLFETGAYEAGTVRVVGYINDEEVAEVEVQSPDKATMLNLQVEDAGAGLQSGGEDAVFVYARVCDAAGRVVTDIAPEVRFTVEGAGVNAGHAQCRPEAGIAATLVRSKAMAGEIKVTAIASGLQEATLRFTAQ